MRTRKLAALGVAAAIAFSTIAPSIASAKVLPGVLPGFRPNVGVTVFFASTISVIADAIFVAATQCRELTAQEAVTATFLPGVGPVYNATLPPASKCKK